MSGAPAAAKAKGRGFGPMTEAGRAALEGLKRRVEESDGAFTYNSGHIELRGGAVNFLDLTLDQVPLALALCQDETQRKRLLEFRLAWEGGADPLAGPASYVALAESGELSRRVKALQEVKAADRYGVFRGAGELRIGGYNMNVGEEREVSGTQGSGTVYFSGCAMHCSFCQFADIAQLKGGQGIDPQQLAQVFLELQERGAHNIQLMTPSHFVPEIVEAVELAAREGLKLPLVYNTGGFEDLDALALLDGIVDVYLPDAKFGTDEAGWRYGGIQGYVENNRAAIAEMFRQVGPLERDERGLAVKGVLVRHLVMPGDAAHQEEIAQGLAAISKDLDVHVMGQWAPSFLTFRTPEVNRTVTDEEVAACKEAFRAAGLHAGLDRDEHAWGV